MLAQDVLTATLEALESLEDLAIDALIVSRVADTFVPGQPQGYQESSYEVKVVITNFNFNELQGQVLASDIKVLVFPFSAIPKPNDELRIGSLKYRIIKSNAQYVGSEIALHEAQARPLGE